MQIGRDWIKGMFGLKNECCHVEVTASGYSLFERQPNQAKKLYEIFSVYKHVPPEITSDRNLIRAGIF